MYCVYLTIYRGKLLPPFYIGYSTVKKINHGYCGSVCSREQGAVWRSEIKQNRHLFKTTIISLHDTQVEAKSKEYFLQLSLKVHKNPLYINKNINGERFFVQYDGPNNPMYGRHHSSETRNKISLAHKGKRTGNKNHMYGKTHTNKTKAKIAKHSREKWTPEMRESISKQKSAGIYITPWGKFHSSKEAVKHQHSLASDYATVIRRCRSKKLGYDFLPKVG